MGGNVTLAHSCMDERCCLSCHVVKLLTTKLADERDNDEGLAIDVERLGEKTGLPRDQ
jgi:hypothetical protein